ncbi:RING finger protein 151 [Microtus ochrogaster]|uniref:RING finger protein 151 n=2 Tax=Microtus ochrogaster TaxID=79684 RepID=A0ABM1U372_MICOH|nr:RING finger protein 151 [Microtus ochrogaster]
MEERLQSCDPAGLGELEAVSQNLGGKGEALDYPELRLLYHPPSEGKGKVALGQSCDWPMLDNATSGGYDLNLFTSLPDYNFLCSVCHGVLKKPMRLPCSHIFCKKCIFQWLARQNSCPCCRQEVKRRKMVQVNKLRKTIGRLQVKCKNAAAGCLVTCPLAHRKSHQNSCPFELMTCPNEGCTARILRGDLDEHRQHCQQDGQQRCPLGCGATLAASEGEQHNCYRELRDAWVQRHERNRTLLLSLLRRVRRVHRTTNFIRRQLAQLGDFLEDDSLLLSSRAQETEVAPEAEMWGVQGQGVL